MKWVQLFSTLAVRCDRRVAMMAAVCASLSAFGATDVSAQAMRPAKLEIGITPTLQIVPQKLAGNSVWAGGFTAAVAHRFHNMFAAEASIMGAYAPQLNYKASSVLNSVNTALSLEVHQKSIHPWDPYVSLGLGRASFRYVDPPDGFNGNSEYMYKRGAVGVRYVLNERINWRAEMSRQFSTFGASNTFMSGVSLRIREKVKQ